MQKNGRKRQNGGPAVPSPRRPNKQDLGILLDTWQRWVSAVLPHKPSRLFLTGNPWEGTPPSPQTQSMYRAMGEILSSQGSSQASLTFPLTQPLLPPAKYTGDPIILIRFSALLEQGLEKASKNITADLKQEFRDLGDHTNTIESKLEATVHRTNQNTDCICDLQTQLEDAIAKID